MPATELGMTTLLLLDGDMGPTLVRKTHLPAGYPALTRSQRPSTAFHESVAFESPGEQRHTFPSQLSLSGVVPKYFCMKAIAPRGSVSAAKVDFDIPSIGPCADVADNALSIPKTLNITLMLIFISS